MMIFLIVNILFDDDFRDCGCCFHSLLEGVFLIIYLTEWFFFFTTNFLTVSAVYGGDLLDSEYCYDEDLPDGGSCMYRSKMGKAILSQPACVSKLLSLLLDQRSVSTVQCV